MYLKDIKKRKKTIVKNYFP